MSDYKLLKKVLLIGKHVETHNTNHYVGNNSLIKPKELKIVKYENDQGFYLFYCDETGKEFTDTYHDSIEEAESQANWEFLVEKNDWINFD